MDCCKDCVLGLKPEDCSEREQCECALIYGLTVAKSNMGAKDIAEFIYENFSKNEIISIISTLSNKLEGDK